MRTWWKRENRREAVLISVCTGNKTRISAAIAFSQLWERKHQFNRINFYATNVFCNHILVHRVYMYINWIYTRVYIAISTQCCVFSCIIRSRRAFKREWWDMMMEIQSLGTLIKYSRHGITRWWCFSLAVRVRVTRDLLSMPFPFLLRRVD